jgi:twinkle protein
MANFFDPPPEDPILFNAEALSQSDEAVICRDRDEVSALTESGVVAAVTVLGGNWLKVLGENSDALSKLRKITIALPDGPMREEVARRLGRHRCWLVDRPIVEIYGMESGLGVLKALADATPYPIEGVQRVTEGSLLRLRRRPAPKTMTTGTQNTDDILKLPTEGRLIVITGIPSHGKTSWTRFVMVHTASRHSRRWCVFSPESQPWEEFVSQCAESYLGKPFYPVGNIEAMTDEEINETEAFLRDRVTMLVCDAEGQAPTLDWLLERFSACVLRFGVTDCLIDPWNEVEQLRGDMSETDYIGRSLQRLKAFGFRYGVNIWIVAHPAKPAPQRPNEKLAAPGPYSINGSSHWANKADLGLTVHSPDPGLSQLHLWKSRLRRWGQRSGQPAIMNYDQLTGVYRTYIKPKTEGDPVGDMQPGLWTS